MTWRALSPSKTQGSASWSALYLASVRSHEVRRGVNGFGSFCRNKKSVLSSAEGDLACRGETRQHRTSYGLKSGGNTCDVFTYQQILKPPKAYPAFTYW
jgi:hypothetical protein